MMQEKKALVIKEMRPIGKTFIVKAFAEENYENVVYINFKDNESAKKIFDGDFVINRITLDISALFSGTHFVPGKTIIIFDEVQECANARASIKAFMLDGRYDVICTGSLLGIKGYNRKKGRGIPTGFEHIIYKVVELPCPSIVTNNPESCIYILKILSILFPSKSRLILERL